MSRNPPPSRSEIRNGILRALSRPDFELLWPALRKVPVKPRQVLHYSGTPMLQVYFIEHGLVSVSAKSARDKWVEVWLIGSEGMTGIPVVLGDRDDPPLRRVVQVGGSAFLIGHDELRNAMKKSPSLTSLLLRYVEVVILQIAQANACNATHELKQRLSRWLLLASDHLGQDEIPLTHQVLSRLLGVRRPSVTHCLGVLADHGGVRNTRAVIQIADRELLEKHACGCHGLIQHEYARLLGRDPRAHEPGPDRSGAAAVAQTG